MYQGYEDPPIESVRFNGSDSLLLGVSMREGGDVITLGAALESKIAKVQQSLPIGLSFDTVTSEPKIVANSVNDFVNSLVEVLVIVLGVSLLTLGWRTGIVVAITIPVVLAATFLAMNFFDIGLHKISLGALILALGLLVDDAIIAVEMMSSKMEQGWDRVKAASFAYSSTAMPMLTEALITVAGFLPIATGEYTRSIFQVSAIALIISWFAAVIFVAYLGYHLLPDYAHKPKPSRLTIWVKTKLGLVDNENDNHHYDIYNTKFYNSFRNLVTNCVRYRKTVIVITLGLFILSIVGFGKVQQQFFSRFYAFRIDD